MRMGFFLSKNFFTRSSLQFLFAVVFVFGGLWGFAANTHAMSITPVHPSDILKKSEFVFVAKVVSIETPATSLPDDREVEQKRLQQYNIKFDIFQAWKWENSTSTVVVSFVSAHSSLLFDLISTIKVGCDTVDGWFKQGEYYLVYAYRNYEGALDADFCNFTSSLAVAQARGDIRELGKPILFLRDLPPQASSFPQPTPSPVLPPSPAPAQKIPTKPTEPVVPKSSSTTVESFPIKISFETPQRPPDTRPTFQGLLYVDIAIIAGTALLVLGFFLLVIYAFFSRKHVGGTFMRSKTLCVIGLIIFSSGVVAHILGVLMPSFYPEPDLELEGEVPCEGVSVFRSLESAFANPDGVCTLLLIDQGLQTLPPEIKKLRNLKVLEAQGNQFTTLPPELFELKNLKSLNLTNNKLEQIPPEIGKMRNLKVLVVSGNKLTTLPKEVGSLQNLFWIDVSQQPIKDLPFELSQLPRLRELGLFDANLEKIPPVVMELRHLEKLFLHSNKLTELPPEIKNLQNLKVLVLDLNRLTTLPPEIGMLRNLNRIDVAGNLISEEEMKKIIQYFPPNISY